MIAFFVGIIKKNYFYYYKYISLKFYKKTLFPLITGKIRGLFIFMLTGCCFALSSYKAGYI